MSEPEEQATVPITRPAPEPDTEDEEIGTVPSLSLGHLQITHHDGRIEEVPLTPRTLKIGRSTQRGNDLVLPDGQVSSSHGRLAYENGVFVLYDDGSTNGTTVNGVPVPKGTPQPLESGNVVAMGKTQILFVGAGKRATPVPTPAPPPSAPPSVYTPSPTRNTGVWKLLGEEERLYPVASDMTVGRGLSADILIVGDGVASEHARLRVINDVLYVEDLASAGGTCVNGERIPERFPVPVRDGDHLHFGSVVLTLRHTNG
jgi:pSer/pThr/pTyr-binding forkhead associated (FHA) protein